MHSHSLLCSSYSRRWLALPFVLFGSGINLPGLDLPALNLIIIVILLVQFNRSVYPYSLDKMIRSKGTSATGVTVWEGNLREKMCNYGT
jgi:hypothetical protein